MESINRFKESISEYISMEYVVIVLLFGLIIYLTMFNKVETKHCCAIIYRRNRARCLC